MYAIRSYYVIIPRFIDTLVGSLLSFGAVTFLWPEWQFQRIPELLSKATLSNTAYLKTVIESLKGDASLPAFTQNRMAAHQADSALAQAWMNMQTDPKPQRRYTHLCSALIYRNHSLLSYISALGIHQELHGSLNASLLSYGELLSGALQESVSALSGKNIEKPLDLSLLSDIPHQPETDQKAGLIHQEMTLIGGMAAEILKLARLLRPLIQAHRVEKRYFWSK